MKQNTKDIILIDLASVREPKIEGKITEGSMGLKCLAEYLRGQGKFVSILAKQENSLFEKEIILSFIPKIARNKPLLLGFSPYQPSSVSVGYPFNDIALIKMIVDKLRRLKVRPYILLGGHFASFNHRELMRDCPWIAFIARGEGEETVDELIDAIKNKKGLEGIKGLTYKIRGKTIANPPRNNIEDLDRLPNPYLEKLHALQIKGGSIKDYYILSSRGCYGNCSFCSIHNFYRLAPGRHGWRGRSAAHVVGEIEMINRERGCRTFIFFDDNFMGPGRIGRERAQQIAREIIRRGIKIRFSIMCRSNDVEGITFKLLKKAGLVRVVIGIESASNAGLEIYNKGLSAARNREALILLNRMGIEVSISFIFLNAYSTLQEIRDNIRFFRFIRKLKYVTVPSGVLFNTLIPYSGTAIKDRLEKDGLLTGDYLTGYAYQFKDKRIRQVLKLCEIFNRLLPCFDQWFQIYSGEMKKIFPKMNSARRPGLADHGRDAYLDLALAAVERAADLLEGREPGRIGPLLKRLQGYTNDWI